MAFDERRDRARLELKAVPMEATDSTPALVSSRVRSPLRDEVAEFDEQELAYLKAELETAREKYRSTLSQYKELTVYCDAFLKDADERRKKAEERAKTLDLDLASLRSTHAGTLTRLEATEEAKARFESEKTEFKGALKERDWELVQLRSRLEEEREKSREALSALEAARRKEVESSFRLEAAERRFDEREKSLNQVFRSLDSVIDSVSEMGGLVETYVERILKNGVNALTEQTGRILCEQVRSELRNLSALQALVRGVSRKPDGRNSE